MVYKHKKNSSYEELNFKFNNIIAYNNQSRNAITHFFDKNVLRLADGRKLNELKHLSEEVPFKWCRDNVNAELKRRYV